MGQCYIFQNQRHIADRACANVCTLQATEGQHLRAASVVSTFASISALPPYHLPLPASPRCLPIISTFASISALPPYHLPLPASPRCLPIIYLCQHLRVASLCHIYLYSILIVKALKIGDDGTNSCCRCTIRSACQKASQSSPRWLSLGTGQQCIDFEQVLPDRIPINQMTTVRHTFTLPVFIWGICV